MPITTTPAAARPPTPPPLHRDLAPPSEPAAQGPANHDGAGPARPQAPPGPGRRSLPAGTRIHVFESLSKQLRGREPGRWDSLQADPLFHATARAAGLVAALVPGTATTIMTPTTFGICRGLFSSVALTWGVKNLIKGGYNHARAMVGELHGTDSENYQPHVALMLSQFSANFGDSEHFPKLKEALDDALYDAKFGMLLANAAGHPEQDVRYASAHMITKDPTVGPALRLVLKDAIASHQTSVHKVSQVLSERVATMGMTLKQARRLETSTFKELEHRLLNLETRLASSSLRVQDRTMLERHKSKYQNHFNTRMKDKVLQGHEPLSRQEADSMGRVLFDQSPEFHETDACISCLLHGHTPCDGTDEGVADYADQMVLRFREQKRAERAAA